MYRKKPHSILAMLALSMTSAWALPSGSFRADVATQWYGLALELTQETPGFSPPVVSRVFGYLGVTLYEAVVPGMEGHSSLAGQLSGLTALPQAETGKEHHWPTAANTALAEISLELFPGEKHAKIKALEARLQQQLQEQELPPEVSTRSARFGRSIATAIAAWARGGGGHQGYARNFSEAYQAPKGPGLWVSTPPALSRPLQPFWGNNRPFVLQSGQECAEIQPPAFSEDLASGFNAQALEVYQISKNLSDEQRQIALFWSDDPGRTSTPPGHWISILTQIVAQQGLSLDRAAQIYARLGMAVADAFIGCWSVKYKYNLLRPITYIQNRLDPNWTPLLTTPPFPEYPSGHSVQSAAAAQVLTQFFGENFAFTDRTHQARGLAPRSFKSFAQAAQEAALSRLYGGIHYRAAIEDGLAHGRCIGDRILALSMLPRG